MFIYSSSGSRPVGIGHSGGIGVGGSGIGRSSTGGRRDNGSSGSSGGGGGLGNGKEDGYMQVKTTTDPSVLVALTAFFWCLSRYSCFVRTLALRVQRVCEVLVIDNMYHVWRCSAVLRSTAARATGTDEYYCYCRRT